MNNLHHQKLYWLYSRYVTNGVLTPIYNSRNYIGFIAKRTSLHPRRRSTTVEIILALQPLNNPKTNQIYLQQQKLYWLYSPNGSALYLKRSTTVEIILALQPKQQRQNDTRHLQQQKLYWLYSRTNSSAKVRVSTTVEIILALQPAPDKGLLYAIYNSRNYIGFIAVFLIPLIFFNLQQQKLYWLYLLCLYI